MSGNIRFKNAISGTPQETPPIWFMRQAGRYHQHYQNLRKSHSFMELCKKPELAAQVALGPVEDFDFDVAILFSDILFPLEALGMGLEYTDSGPRLGWQLTTETFGQLRSKDEALPGLLFQKEAVVQTRKILPTTKSLIGFIGAPWTLFTYAVQGRHEGALISAKTQLFLFRRFCEILVPLLKDNIQAQLDGGAELVMLFDTAAGELSPSLFNSLVVPEIEKLIKGFRGRIGYYAKSVNDQHLSAKIFSDGSFAGLGFDHRWEIPNLLKTKMYSGFKQGSFDQALLFLEPEQFKIQLENYLKPFTNLSSKERASWVCGLGHGVLPRTPEQNIRTFITTVRKTFK